MQFARPLAVLVLAVGGCACRSAAIKEVVEGSMDYQSHLETTPARVRVETVDDYLNRVAACIMNASRRWEDAQALQVEAERKRSRRNGALATSISSEHIEFYDEFSVYVVHSVAPNAATPGDNCAELTTRLFLELECPEELVAVLCHEFAHVQLEHQVNQVLRRKQHAVGVGIVAGLGAAADAYAASLNPQHKMQDWDGMYQEAVSAYKPWDKRDEFAADSRGLDYYLELGLDPAKYVLVFELLSRWGDDESETHPRISDRIQRINDRLAELHGHEVDVDEQLSPLLASGVLEGASAIARV